MGTTKPKHAGAAAASEAPAEAQTPAGATTEAVESAAPAAPAAHKPEEAPESYDVRVLAPVTIAGTRYEPNDVIEGLPLALIEAHAGSVDDHPDAVTYARENGGAVKPFTGSAHEED